MTNEETQVAIKFLAASWPQPMSDDQARTYGVRLAKHPFGKVMSILNDLADSEEWRPAWAKINKRLAPPAKGPLEAFQRALSIVNIYSPDQREQNAPDAVRATVARLGGWRVIGQMKTEEQQWNEKRWAAAWEEVHAEIVAGRPMSELLPAPRVLPRLQDAHRNVFGEIMDRSAASDALAAMLGKGVE